MTATWRPSAPAEARQLAASFAELAVAVEAGCQRDGCAPDCPVAAASRRAAVSAFELAQEWTAEECEP